MATYRRDGRRHLKKRADGRYRAMYKGQLFYGYTEDEVYDHIEEAKRQEAEGIRSREDPTVAEYGNRWLHTHKASVSDKVYNDYVGHMNALYKTLGDKKLREVKPSDIKAAYIPYIGRSASTIKRARMLWVGMLESAVADGYLRTNPAKDRTAQPHKGPSGSHRAITQAERQLILNTDHYMKPLVCLMLYSGLRRGEALAINVDDDIDFTNKTITVSKAIRYNGNQPELVDPKTEAGARTVPLLPILEEILRGRHGLLLGKLIEKEEAGKKIREWHYATEQMFRRGWDSYLNALMMAANGMQKRWYGKTREQKAIIKAGGELPPWQDINIRPHDLRHSFATMARDAGVEMHVCMKILGHADEKMILRIYDHVEGRMATNIQRLAEYTDPNTDPNNSAQNGSNERKTS